MPLFNEDAVRNQSTGSLLSVKEYDSIHNSINHGVGKKTVNQWICKIIETEV